MLEESTRALLHSLKSLQISGDYADLKLYCKNQVFQAHKVVLCPRSQFFAKACTWGLDQHSKGEVDLNDDNPKMIKLMIDYLYRLDYDDILPLDAVQQNDQSASDEPSSPVADKVKFFEGKASEGDPEPAESSDPPRVAWDHGLSTKGKRKKEKEMRSAGTWEDRVTQEMLDTDDIAAVDEPEIYHTDDAVVAPNTLEIGIARLQDFVGDPQAERIIVNADMYALADKYGIEDLKLLAKSKFFDAIEQNWKSEAFVRGAELAFNNTPTSDLGLRDIVATTLYEHQELTDYEEIQALLNSGNGIAWQFLKVLLAEQQKEKSRTFNDWS